MKVGVIGVGNMGQNHVRVYSELGVEIVGVADLDMRKAVTVGDRYGVSSFGDYNDLLKRKPDAVTVAVPTIEHNMVALSVIAQGVNLLVEKPIAMFSWQGKDMVKAAEKNGVKLMVGYLERFNPVVAKLKEIIADGIIGTPILLSVRRVGAFPPANDAGVMLDLASHDIDVLRYVLDTEPLSVFSRISCRQYKNGDCGLVVMDFPDVVASIEVNYLTPHKVRTMVVTGTKGIAYLDYIQQSLTIHNAGWKIEPQFEKGEPLKLEVKHFLDCIEHDKQPLTNGYEALKTLEIALKAEEKAKGEK